MKEQELDEYRHFILYAKGHYARSSNCMDDLRTIQADYSGVRTEYLSDGMVYSMISDIFLKYCPQRRVAEIFDEMFRWLRSVSRKDMVQLMLGKLSVVPVMKDGEKILHLGDPDPQVLPLSEAAEEHQKRKALTQEVIC